MVQPNEGYAQLVIRFPVGPVKGYPKVAIRIRYGLKRAWRKGKKKKKGLTDTVRSKVIFQVRWLYTVIEIKTSEMCGYYFGDVFLFSHQLWMYFVFTVSINL